MPEMDSEILKELQRITRLLVLLATKGQIQKDKIAALANIGFRPKEIADFIGTTPNTVSVALVDIRKRGGGDNAKSKGASKQRTAAGNDAAS